jgi:hypothetical protein
VFSLVQFWEAIKSQIGKKMKLSANICLAIGGFPQKFAH